MSTDQSARPARDPAPTDQSPILQVEDLHVVYETPRGPVKAVDGVSFSLRPGERMGLIGESGSGKTTMATALLRLTRPPGRIVSGRVRLGDMDMLALNDHELRRARLREIALIPQAAMNSLNPVLRVSDQIIDGVIAHGGEVTRGQRRELRERVLAVLGEVGLPAAVADRFPHQLSGGMKQRAAMAIAIALRPKVIIADEPTSALDVVVQRQVMATLSQVQEGLGAAVVLIGHDMGLVAQFADIIGVLYAGRLAEQGPIDAVLDNPRHPYTRLLIDSLPSLDEKKELRGIPGLPPALLNLPPGCPFHPRCPFAFDRCRVEAPALQHVGPEHRVACHLYPTHAALPPLPAASSIEAERPRAGNASATETPS